MNDDYAEIVRLIKEQTKELETDAAVMSVMDSVAAVADAATGGSFGALNSAGQALYSKLKGGDDGSSIPNPWFVFNGQADGTNVYSQKYARNRGRKSKGATAITVAGAAASAGTGGVDVGGALVHGNASLSTAAHMQKIRAIAGKHKQTRTIAEWCRVVMLAKALKASIRGGQFAGAVIPAASLPASVAAAIATTGVKLTMTNLCYTTAANIHWRAYQEQAISGGLGLGVGGKTGPASMIFWEIFTRRGFTRMFGQYDVAQLVREPAGWRALADKLLLI